MSVREMQTGLCITGRCAGASSVYIIEVVSVARDSGFVLDQC